MNNDSKVVWCASKSTRNTLAYCHIALCYRVGGKANEKLFPLKMRRYKSLDGLLSAPAVSSCKLRRLFPTFSAIHVMISSWDSWLSKQRTDGIEGIGEGFAQPCLYAIPWYAPYIQWDGKEAARVINSHLVSLRHLARSGWRSHACPQNKRNWWKQQQRKTKMKWTRRISTA